VAPAPAAATQPGAGQAAAAAVPPTGAKPAPSLGIVPPAAVAAIQPTLPVAQAGFVAFPRERVPAYAIPQTPLPANLTFDDNLRGDPANGAKLVTTGACIGCHSIKGLPMMVGVTGPNLTHVASRTTIAAGLYPNDARHLARWIKNARVMKPGVTMITLGAGEYDPIMKSKVTPGYTDQQIADIVAYLQTLK